MILIAAEVTDQGTATHLLFPSNIYIWPATSHSSFSIDKHVTDHTCRREAWKRMLSSEICFTFLLSGCGIIKSTSEVSLNLGHCLNIAFDWRGTQKRKMLAKNPHPVKDFPLGKSQAIVCLQPIIGIHSAASLWICQVSNVIYKSVPVWLPQLVLIRLL